MHAKVPCRQNNVWFWNEQALIDPESLEDFIVHDGYHALGKALTSMTPARM